MREVEEGPDTHEETGNSPSSSSRRPRLASSRRFASRLVDANADEINTTSRGNHATDDTDNSDGGAGASGNSNHDDASTFSDDWEDDSPALSPAVRHAR